MALILSLIMIIPMDMSGIFNNRINASAAETVIGKNGTTFTY